MREHLEQSLKRHHKHERQRWRWLLAAVNLYCEGVARFGQDLCGLEVSSRGLSALRDYLAEYLAAATFRTLVAKTAKLTFELPAIRYRLLIKGGSITVRQDDGEIDYSAAVEKTFEKFRRGAVADYRVEFPARTGMNDVEASVLDRVALLNPDTFRALDEYCVEQVNYLDERVARFDREIQFYVYLGIFAHYPGTIPP